MKDTLGNEVECPHTFEYRCGKILKCPICEASNPPAVAQSLKCPICGQDLKAWKCGCPEAPADAQVGYIGIEPNPRNFPEDFAHENGKYQNSCRDCGHLFYGHKQRVICKLCSKAEVESIERLDKYRDVSGEALPSVAQERPTPRTDKVFNTLCGGDHKLLMPGELCIYPEMQGVERELAEANEKLAEAWKLVNAMAGQEPWERAEQWLEDNRKFAPEGAQRV